MTSNGHNAFVRRAAAAPLMLGLLLGASWAQAQNFESYYGEKSWRDSGEDVKSINFCRSGGSIIVGTRTADDGSRQALVTQVDNTGNVFVQRAFPIGGSKDSTAYAVVELSSGKGFAVTGSVAQGGTNYIYVLQIDCKSNPVWTTILMNPKAGTLATGYDILEAGPDATGATRGELIVIGDDVVDPNSQATQGRIARLTAAGGVIWNNIYARSDVQLGLRFRAGAENLAASGAFTDIVVAGSTGEGPNWNINRRALMFRVDAGGNPVCNATLALNTEEIRDFYGLTPLRNSSAYYGDSVLVGDTAVIGSPAQVYLARFVSRTCDPKEQSVWIDRQNAEAIAFDAVEVAARDGTAGSVVAAGSLAGSWTRHQGILLAARIPDLLQSAPLPPRRFGGSTDDPDSLLRSIDLKADRFVAAGSTYTDWDGVGDREDFYLVQTDPNMGTACAKPWEPAVQRTDVPFKRFDPKLQKLPRAASVQTLPIETGDMGYCCKVTEPFGL